MCCIPTKGFVLAYCKRIQIADGRQRSKRFKKGRSYMICRGQKQHRNLCNSTYILNMTSARQVDSPLLFQRKWYCNGSLPFLGAEAFQQLCSDSCSPLRDRVGRWVSSSPAPGWNPSGPKTMESYIIISELRNAIPCDVLKSIFFICVMCANLGIHLIFHGPGSH